MCNLLLYFCRLLKKIVCVFPFYLQMTKKRREEMIMYKQQACITETKVNSRKKENSIHHAKTSPINDQVKFITVKSLDFKSDCFLAKKRNIDHIG